MAEQWIGRTHFDQLARKYDCYRMLDEAPVDYIIRAINRTDQSICDLGCGTGRYLIALIKAFQASGVVVKAAHGVDTSDGMLKTTKLEGDIHHPSINWVLASSDRTGLPSQSISLVTAFNSIHHLPIPETLAEVERILLPNGFFAIYTRLLEQESEHIWGQWFPRYSEYSQVPTREVMSNLFEHHEYIRLVSAQDFTFERKVSFTWICEQTENKYYSTLGRYPQQEFETAYSAFVENIKSNYEYLDKITYPSNYSIFLYQLAS
ncbi:MAG: class I SAM-dependent methyltransferase [Chloroflexi bacterium]|nr:class I SAM-dependent methyltransferase [Chloroflexota bacterium]